jgi:hypothetical protein
MAIKSSARPSHDDFFILRDLSDAIVSCEKTGEGRCQHGRLSITTTAPTDLVATKLTPNFLRRSTRFAPPALEKQSVCVHKCPLRWANLKCADFF